jgi:hypothetical protein
MLAAVPDHEFRTKDTYGDIPGTNLLDWPLTLAELEPYYDKAEDKMGVTGTQGIPFLDADNNQMVTTRWFFSSLRARTATADPA